jgi:hypothetical protein
MNMDSLENSAQSISHQNIKRLKPSYPGFVPVAPSIKQPSKKKDDKRGYHMLSSKLKIGLKSLCSVLPTSNKALSTRDWKVF